MKKIKIVLLIICCIIIGCSRQLYMPASGDASKQQELLAGREIYVNHCGSCHNLHLPKEYSAEKWKKQLDEMQEKAKITDEQKKLVLQYLLSQP